MEWPAKRSYVGLVAVGVQEQAEDTSLLVLLLLRNCLTLMTFPFPVIISHPRTVVLAIVFTVRPLKKMSVMMMTLMIVRAVT